jgi:DNA-binding transcriptional regulator YhcF (GntR family)
MVSEFGSPSKSGRIISTITEWIRNGEIATGKAIPSINSAAGKFGVARKTVVRAYNVLIRQGLIESRPKRGYFVVNRRPDVKLKILLVIHSLNACLELLYNEFRKLVKDDCEIEIFFHHYNIKILEMILNRNSEDYDLFIISSFDHSRIPNVIGRIPAGKILIISRDDRIENKYNSIVQDFFEGTCRALEAAHDRISKYNKFHLSFPEKSGHPITLEKGFVKFCSDYHIPYVIEDSLKDAEIIKGDAYLVIDDGDLIKLLKTCKVRNWRPGRDIGVVSYNETPLKEVIREGISIISCSFKIMAEEMAEFIKNRIAVQKIIPIKFIKRNSL